MTEHESGSDNQAWVAAVTEALGAVGSWTGRTHIHKHLFLAFELAGSRAPFKFEFYDFGPYSFDLDREIAEMELFGFLSMDYPKPGYGPKYGVSGDGSKVAARLETTDRNVVDKVAKAIGDSNSTKLEIMATCVWIERREKVTDRDAIVKRVLELKPKFEGEEVRVRDGLKDVRDIAKILEVSSPK